jgi:hypothetical protein
MKTLPYYVQLSPLVHEKLKRYKTDFTVHDQAELQNYKGAFIQGVRSHGTNLFLMDNDYIQSYALPLFNKNNDVASIDCLYANINAFLFSNDWYFIGENGVVKCATKDQAIQKLKSWKELIEDCFDKKMLSVTK